MFRLTEFHSRLIEMSSGIEGHPDHEGLSSWEADPVTGVPRPASKLLFPLSNGSIAFIPHEHADLSSALSPFTLKETM